MTQAKEAVERGLELYRELVSEIPALEAEFQASRLEFAGPRAAAALEAPDQAADPMAARRHLEWFLLERPSPNLEGVPVEILQDVWFERAEELERGAAQAFLHSLAGAFEVTSSEPGRGIWISDLFAMGEIPIEEPDAAPEIQVGDLLIGRVFPIGDGVHRLSPAVTCFRNTGLLAAVRADLKRMREGRRGVLRIQQLELERLFYTANADGGGYNAPDDDVAQAPESVDAARRRLHAELVEAGLDAGLAAEVLETVVSEPRTPGLVTEVLNQLAFETDVDLEHARKALAELWALSPQAAQVPAPKVTHSTTDSEADPRAALAAFDEGRAAGRDLDQLFSELAGNLGVEVPTDDDPDGSPPDFPGVVGAMVEEFLWDIGREKGAPQAERFACLRSFSEYGQNLGVFENIGRRELIDFAGRWLLDEGRCANTEEVRAVFDALEEFCRWTEERHAHDLWTQAESNLDRLRRDVPRILLLRQRIEGTREESGTPHRVLAVNGDVCHLAVAAGGEAEGRLPEGTRDLVQPADVLHARVDDAGNLRISRAYPGELQQLLTRDHSE